MKYLVFFLLSALLLTAQLAPKRSSKFKVARNAEGNVPWESLTDGQVCDAAPAVIQALNTRASESLRQSDITEGCFKMATPKTEAERTAAWAACRAKRDQYETGFAPKNVQLFRDVRGLRATVLRRTGKSAEASAQAEVNGRRDLTMKAFILESTVNQFCSAH